MNVGFLLDLAWKGTAILLIARAITWAMYRAPAAARHWVWTLALSALLLLPLTMGIGPRWKLAVLPARGADGSRPGEAAPIALVESTLGDLRPSELRPVELVRPHANGGRRWRSALSASPTLLILAWTAGAALSLARLVLGFVFARSIVQRARVASSDDWRRLLADAAAIVGLKSHVSLRFSPHISVPVTCGLTSPTLLLPEEAAGWPQPLRRAVLLHELAHVARRDCLVQVIGHAARSIHWFNPLAFLAVRRLRDEQERACDAAAIAGGVSPADYAGHLCDVAAAFRSDAPSEWVALAMARTSDLDGRVRAILAAEGRHRPPGRAFHSAVTVGALCVIPLGSLQLAAVALSEPRRSQIPAMPLATQAMGPAPTAVPAVPIVVGHPSRLPREPLRALDRVPTPDFTGTWVLDQARSASPSLPRGDPRRDSDWGEVVVIRQGPHALSLNIRRGEVITSANFVLDDREYRHVEQRAPAGGGTTLRGHDVRASWDGGKLVTLTRPFSLWVADAADEATTPTGPGTELLNVHRLSENGQQMIVERVNRHDWGWGSDGREPSAAYARVIDVYWKARVN
jgi:beta-lactamase regulating signal transducer with metallopeptidase domain